jgi:hypothetical protein
VVSQVKINTRREFDQGRLSGAELVQLMHGLARMPRYAPNQGWLAAVTKAAQHHLGDLAPGAPSTTLYCMYRLYCWMQPACRCTLYC